MTNVGMFEEVEVLRKKNKKIKELNNSLSIALEINNKYQRENKDLEDNSPF